MKENQIDKDGALHKYFSKSIPGPDDEYEKLLEAIEKQVVSDFKSKGIASPSVSAFGNASGDWYEIMVAAEFWNVCVDRDVMAVLLPNKSSLPFQHLYGGESRAALDRLFEVMAKKNVTLLASNPDFLIVNKSKLAAKKLKSKITRLGPDEVKIIRTAYLEFVGECAYKDIRGAVGLKTSNRPDRRLQSVQEGSVLKAIAAHFQARFWDADYRVKYVAATLNSSDADDEALKTAATHTLVSVNMPIERAVDSITQLQRPREVRALLASVL